MEYSLVSLSRLRIGVAATGAKNWNLGPIQPQFNNSSTC